MGSLGVVTLGMPKPGAEIDLYGFVCSRGCVVGAFVRVVLGSTATGQVFRSWVTQKAAPGAASGPAAFTIELGKPAVGVELRGASEWLVRWWKG